ncbi:MAG: hypothetical protein NTY16_08310, partial [Deltaproteobacteria bacterium]|nr:hypothetical protein [Deltaproteobacteria bacterium]
VHTKRVLQFFSEKIFQELYPSGLKRQHALRKGELKDALVAHPPYRNQRIDELILNYRANPEHFYRETPFHGILFFTQHTGVDEFIGSSRIKRVRRLAEKAARRIIDRMFDAIKKHADDLADDRARGMGIPREQLVTPPEEMLNEFLKAEDRLLEDLRRGRPLQDAGDIVISDVAGIKMILETPRQERLRSLLNDLPDCRVTEEEHHTGLYNATNLIVCHRPDRERILSQPLSGRILAVMQARGLNPDRVQQAFAEFVQSGEETVSLEIIVSDFQETLESEIGRCMHEDRIIRQRLHQPYRGFLSRNTEYLMEYLFAFPESSQLDLPELPIRLWNRYLPDYFDEVLKELFQIPSNGLLDETIS